MERGGAGRDETSSQINIGIGIGIGMGDGDQNCNYNYNYHDDKNTITTAATKSTATMSAMTTAATTTMTNPRKNDNITQWHADSRPRWPVDLIRQGRQVLCRYEKLDDDGLVECVCGWSQNYLNRIELNRVICLAVCLMDVH